MLDERANREPGGAGARPFGGDDRLDGRDTQDRGGVRSAGRGLSG
jgi:hypothetical protein